MKPATVNPKSATATAGTAIVTTMTVDREATERWKGQDGKVQESTE